MPYSFHFSNKTSPVLDSAIFSKTVGVVVASLSGILLLKYIFNKQENNQLVDELNKIQDLLEPTKQDDNDKKEENCDESDLDDDTKKIIKKKLEVIPLEEINETLDDLIENKAKKEIIQLSAAIKKTEKFKTMGAEVPKGVILTGCDEAEKNLFVKTFANEIRRKIVKIDMLDSVDKFDDILKDHDKILDSILKKVEDQGKSSLILIENLIFKADEFNEISVKRITKVLNKLLDGIFKVDANLFVFINSTFIDDNETNSTGTLHSIDLESKISRPNRFLKLIHLEKPNFKERLELIQKFTKNLETDDDIDEIIENLAERTVEFQTSTIRRIVNDAALKAAQKGESVVKKEYFDNAFKDFIENLWGNNGYFYFFGDFNKVKETPIGTANGLACISSDSINFGDVLYFESVCVGFEKKEGKFGSIRATGQMEACLQESVTIAHSFVQSFCLKRSEEGSEKFKKAHEFLQKAHIHLNRPQASCSSGGNSGGVAIATAILSLALKEPVRYKLNMTGEISLNGRVLPVGGIPKKILAAKRSGVDKVIIPEVNKRDLEYLSDRAKDGIEICLVENYDDVFEIAFQGIE